MKWKLAGGLLALLVAIPSVGLCDGNPSSIDDARHTIAFMQTSAHGIAALLMRARHMEDARATACENTSLSEADVLTRRARERFGALADAHARGDVAEETRLVSLIREDRATQRDVEKAAFACVGVVSNVHGKDVVTVRVTIDKDIAQDPRN